MRTIYLLALLIFFTSCTKRDTTSEGLLEIDSTSLDSIDLQKVLYSYSGSCKQIRKFNHLHSEILNFLSEDSCRYELYLYPDKTYKVIKEDLRGVRVVAEVLKINSAVVSAIASGKWIDLKTKVKLENFGFVYSKGTSDNFHLKIDNKKYIKDGNTEIKLESTYTTLDTNALEADLCNEKQKSVSTSADFSAVTLRGFLDSGDRHFFIKKFNLDDLGLGSLNEPARMYPNGGDESKYCVAQSNCIQYLKLDIDGSGMAVFEKDKVKINWFLSDQILIVKSEKQEVENIMVPTKYGNSIYEEKRDINWFRD